MTGWRDGLGPWTPVIEGDRLYGRGGADDGYAAFAALLGDRGRPVPTVSPRPLRRARSRPARSRAAPTCPPTSTRLADRLGRPELVICLDSGAARHGASVGHHVAAWPRRRRADASTCSARASTPGRRAASCRRASGSSASSSTASRTPRPARCSCPRCTSRSRPTGLAEAEATAAELGPRRSSDFPCSPGRPARCPTTPSSSSSPAPGARRSATSAPTAARRRAGPATCCARSRRSR